MWWISSSSLGEPAPAFVFDDAGSEFSLLWDARIRSFVHVASYGFDASTIGLRSATLLTRPWNSPIFGYRPPESDRLRPFVYAARVHPEFFGTNAKDLVVTYATNSYDFRELLAQ
jgi:hypothetical protein